MKQIRIIIFSIMFLSILLTKIFAQVNNHIGAEYGKYEVSNEKIISSSESAVDESNIELSLNGDWVVKVDSMSLGESNHWYEGIEGGTVIQLPGILDQYGIGTPETATIHRLTRKNKYIGKAWYEREIIIPEGWANKSLQLYLSRVMWECNLYVDGVLIGTEESLSTPHVFEMPDLSPGKHRITLCIDNSPRAGASCHGYGQEMQIQWNGVVGKMLLRAKDEVYVSSIKTYPDIEKKQVRVLTSLSNVHKKTIRGKLTINLRLKGETAVISTNETFVRVAGKDYLTDLVLCVGDKMQLWNEFNPALYEIEAMFIGEGDISDVERSVFGFRKLSREGNMLLLNNKPCFLRGTHDSGLFPLLGYISADKSSWSELFGKYKEYGLNHVRFHSVCPPKEALEAADELGILIQAELPIWAQISENWEGANFLQRELNRILEMYGNHPSFGFFSLGNENSGEWDYLDRTIQRAKIIDPRHLYMSTSNQYIRKTQEVQVGEYDDFSTVMWASEKSGFRPNNKIRYMERLVQGQPIDRSSDYKTLVDDFDVPYIAHELGQYWMYPDFDEIEKYTGVLRPSGLEMMKDGVESKKLTPWAKKFHKASVAQAVQLYKEDIEKMLRTSNVSGYQLLDIRDYPGQSCALVGLLDIFGDSKGVLTKEEFHKYCAPIVILTRIPKINYISGDSLTVEIDIRNNSYDDIANENLEWKITDRKGNIIYNGSMNDVSAKIGEVSNVGKIAVRLNNLFAEEYTISATMSNGQITNDWKIWSYQSTPTKTKNAGKIRVATEFNYELLKYIENGGKVLYFAKDLVNLAPVEYINPVWTPEATNIQTCGTLIDNRHPIFKEFPTSSFSDLNWYNILTRSYAFVLDKLPANYTPIVWNIDSPSIFRNFKLGSIIECKYGKGLLVATSLPLDEKSRAEYPEVRQLKQAMINYTASANLRNVPSLNREEIESIFKSKKVDIVTSIESEGRKILEVIPSGNMKEDGMIVWKQDNDDVLIKEDSVDYKLHRPAWRQRGSSNTNANFCKDGNKTWSLDRCDLDIKLPQNFKGVLHLQFYKPEQFGGNFYVNDEQIRVDKQLSNKYLSISVVPSMLDNEGVLSMRFFIDQDRYPMLINKLILFSK